MTGWTIGDDSPWNEATKAVGEFPESRVNVDLPIRVNDQLKILSGSVHCHQSHQEECSCDDEVEYHGDDDQTG